MAKKGRKAQHYRDPDTGKEIHGLGCKPTGKDGKPGRFYAIYDPKRTATFGAEPKAAIVKFRAWQHKTRGERPLLVFGVDDAVRAVAGNGEIRVPGTNGDGTPGTTDRDTWDRSLRFCADYECLPDHLKQLVIGSPAFDACWTQYTEERGLDPEVRAEGYGAEFIDWTYGRFIKSDPIGAAQALDDPRLKTLDTQESPPPSLRLSEISNLYEDRVDVDPTTKRRARGRFDLFVRAVGVKTVKEIDAGHIEAYRKRILGERDANRFSPCWVRRRFGIVKTMLAHALKRGRDQEQLNRVLGLCKMLEAPKCLKVADARPITRGELAAILAVADDRETAIVLLSLNCAFYTIDVCRIPESALDLDKGHVVFPRIKVGRPIPRVAMLWPRTVDALRKYLKGHPHSATDEDGVKLLFANKRFGTKLTASTLGRDWQHLRERAHVPDLHFGYFRDGAYTAAVEAGISDTHCEVLLGHSISGSKDAYLKRRPELLTPACAAIEKHYFG